MTDPWDAFGDDSSEEEEVDDERQQQNQSKLVQAGITYLTQHFVKQNPHIGLAKRIVAISKACGDTSDSISSWKDALCQRGVQILSPGESGSPCDAAIITNSDYSLQQHVVPGGCVMLMTLADQEPSVEHFHPAVWNVPCSDANLVEEDDGVKLWFVIRWRCPANTLSCPWKSKGQSRNELGLLQQATIVPSAYEVMHCPPLTTHAMSQAVTALRNYGYCIVRNLLDQTKCRAWGQAVLQDLRDASQILLTRDQIDLYHPHDSRQEPQSYRELSMREDLRMDLRDGPRMRKMRAGEGCGVPDTQAPAIVHHAFSYESDQSCLRFHPTVLHIVQQTLNPTDATLAPGNFGRFNFDGSGPDGSPQPLRVGPMGSIISLPGSADQAIHADTPHLFETYDCLPAHYVNAFCLGADIVYEKDGFGMSTGASLVGGTAFVHASHKLSFTASLKENWSVNTEPRVLQNLVRPSLDVGDVLLFDCRVLHFGLANTSKDVERPLLYTNMTQVWFHDPKNWNNNEAIFPTI